MISLIVVIWTCPEQFLLCIYVHHKHLLGNKWSNKKNYKGNQNESVFIILEKLVVSNNPKVTGKSRVNYNLNFTRGKVFTLYKYARNQQ